MNDSPESQVSREEEIQEVVDRFLADRATNPDLDSDQLVQQHAHLMPELKAALGRVLMIDIARQGAEAAERATTETVAYNGPPTQVPGLHVRCPHCFFQICIDDEENLEDILCRACGNDFGLVGGDSDELRQIGNFEFVERLGAGSFGTVWKALDKDLDRFVAIKVPRKGKLESGEIEQFIREARVTARLKHPGIVKVYEVGRDGDSVYIVSDLINGSTLNAWRQERGLSFREAVELCVGICDALQHAHESGVFHRDLKPANILIDMTGKTFLTDFGLAKRVASEVTITADGHILGTPAYMSPEQAAGRSASSDARTDIYSIGVILFELLTGDRPFRGDTSRLIQKVIHDEPPRLRDLRRSVPRDLETITLKCLEKDPDRRYPSASELCDDLSRWLDNLPIKARPIGTIERSRRWCVRHPMIAAVVSTAVLTLTLSTIAGLSVAKTRRAGLRVALRELHAHAHSDSSSMLALKRLVAEQGEKLAKARIDLSQTDQLQEEVDAIYHRFHHFNRRESSTFASWYLLDTKGRMLAVCPEGDAVGKYFSNRDYFQGAMSHPGVVRPSTPFQSKNDGLYKFALSVAIVDPDDRLIRGVLAASVATESTRAIQREETLIRRMVFWTFVTLIPPLLLAISSLAIFITGQLQLDEDRTRMQSGCD